LKIPFFFNFQGISDTTKVSVFKKLGAIKRSLFGRAYAATVPSCQKKRERILSAALSVFSGCFFAQPPGVGSAPAPSPQKIKEIISSQL